MNPSAYLKRSARHYVEYRPSFPDHSERYVADVLAVSRVWRRDATDRHVGVSDLQTFAKVNFTNGTCDKFFANEIAMSPEPRCLSQISVCHKMSEVSHGSEHPRPGFYIVSELPTIQVAVMEGIVIAVLDSEGCATFIALESQPSLGCVLLIVNQILVGRLIAGFLSPVQWTNVHVHCLSQCPAG